MKKREDRFGIEQTLLLKALKCALHNEQAVAQSSAIHLGRSNGEFLFIEMVEDDRRVEGDSFSASASSCSMLARLGEPLGAQEGSRWVKLQCLEKIVSLATFLDLGAILLIPTSPTALFKRPTTYHKTR